MSNYNNDNRPFKKGRMSDVIKPKRRLFTRIPKKKSNEAEVIALKVDLIHILADLGIVLQNTHTIARALVKLGWVKTINIEKDTQ